MSDISGLTGEGVRSVRLIKQSNQNNQVIWGDTIPLSRFDVGLEGFTEILDVYDKTNVVAHFSTTDEVMNNKPAAIQKKSGKGMVLKLAFWPDKNQFTQLLSQISTGIDKYIAKPVDEGIQTIPRTDNSIFIINTSGVGRTIDLFMPMKDRITEEQYAKEFVLKPYSVLWLE
jgi:hypothetical protein